MQTEWDNNGFNLALREWRAAKKGRSFKALAEAAGIKPQTLRNVLDGQGGLSADVAHKIADIINGSVTSFVKNAGIAGNNNIDEKLLYSIIVDVELFLLRNRLRMPPERKALWICNCYKWALTLPGRGETQSDRDRIPELIRLTLSPEVQCEIQPKKPKE